MTMPKRKRYSQMNAAELALPYPGAPAGQVLVGMLGDDRIAVAGGVSAAALKLLLDAIALVRRRTGRESAMKGASTF